MLASPQTLDPKAPSTLSKAIGELLEQLDQLRKGNLGKNEGQLQTTKGYSRTNRNQKPSRLVLIYDCIAWGYSNIIEIFC